MIYLTILRALVCLLFLTPLSFSQTSPAGPTKPEAEKWREDLRYMVREMEARHKNLFHTVSRDKLDTAVKKLHERIPDLARHEIIVDMMRIVAMVGDGHSNIYPTRDAKIAFRSLPVKLYLFSDGMFVRAANAAHRDLVGSRVSKIGDVPVEEAISRVREIVGHDNEMGVRFFVPILLTMPEVLHALKLSRSVDVASFSVEKAGASRVVELTPIGPVEIMPADTDLSWMPKEGWTDMRDGSSGTEPLWLKNPKDMFWMQTLPGRKALYAQINQVGNKETESLADFSNRMIAFAESSQAERLIIDLRLNRGGNGMLLTPLEVGLIKSKFDKPGKLYFLIGRSTWSASQFLLNWAEKYTNGVFVGEPSASKGNVYGDSRRITLPNSGVTARVSVYYWQDWVPWDTRERTSPHVSVELSSADYAANRDPVLYAALEHTPRRKLVDLLNDAILGGGGASAVKSFRIFKSEPVNKFADTEEALLIAGQKLLNEKKPDQAMMLFEIVKEDHPRSFRGYHAAGVAHAQMGNKDEAVRNLKKAVELDPKNYDVAELLKRTATP